MIGTALCLAAPSFATETARDAVIARSANADVVILGEIHDNPAHHRLQADILDHIAASAIVFEMLSPQDAQAITPDLALAPAALAYALAWEESGWPDFAFYYPLLAYGAEIPIYGAEVDRAQAGRAFQEGAAGVFGEDAARFGLDLPLPEAQQTTREAQQMTAHCDALPEDILPGFVEAQRLRDAALAQATLTALDAHGAPVVVITGNGHARADWGVPALLRLAAPDLVVVTLGQFEAQPPADAPFDVTAEADPVDRPDPCEAFR